MSKGRNGHQSGPVNGAAAVVPSKKTVEDLLLEMQRSLQAIETGKPFANNKQQFLSAIAAQAQSQGAGVVKDFNRFLTTINENIAKINSALGVRPAEGLQQIQNEDAHKIQEAAHAFVRKLSGIYKVKLEGPSGSAKVASDYFSSLLGRTRDVTLLSLVKDQLQGYDFNSAAELSSVVYAKRNGSPAASPAPVPAQRAASPAPVPAQRAASPAPVPAPRAASPAPAPALRAASPAPAPAQRAASPVAAAPRVASPVAAAPRAASPVAAAPRVASPVVAAPRAASPVATPAPAAAPAHVSRGPSPAPASAAPGAKSPAPASAKASPPVSPKPAEEHKPVAAEAKPVEAKKQNIFARVWAAIVSAFKRAYNAIAGLFKKGTNKDENKGSDASAPVTPGYVAPNKSSTVVGPVVAAARGVTTTPEAKPDVARTGSSLGKK
ncbi:MAG: hypothetical protein V4490_08350 [Pseudomonadota bacterium]